MAQKATTDGGTDAENGDDEIDLLNEEPTAGFTVSSNNEEVEIYGDGLGGELGCVEHTYDGLPARGVVRYDVDGYEIVDMEFDPEDDDATMEEQFDALEAEIREWIESALFESGVSSAEANIYREKTHTVVVENPWEGDRYTIELETSNKRRIR